MHKTKVLFTGGLGNQLFQYVFMVYLKEIKKTIPSYNVSFYKKNSIHSGFEADKVFDFKEFDKDTHNLYFFYQISRGIRNRLRINKSIVCGEDNNFDENLRYWFYRGYWQDARFFLAVKDKLNDSLLDLNKFADKEWCMKIKNSKSVFVHVRRGDYLNDDKYFNLTSTKYYLNSIKYMLDAHPSVHFFVFSDDIAWCRQYFKGLDEIDFVEYSNQSTIGDLSLMTMCENAIIANSSFSWWGAALGEKEIVVRPTAYYTNQTVHNLYLDEWIPIQG